MGEIVHLIQTVKEKIVSKVFSRDKFSKIFLTGSIVSIRSKSVTLHNHLIVTIYMYTYYDHEWWYKKFISQMVIKLSTCHRVKSGMIVKLEANIIIC